MKRGKKVFLASALLLLAVLGGAALVFREGIRERCLIWRFEHGSPQQSAVAAKELGDLGSLRAIAPLAAAIEAPSELIPELSGTYESSFIASLSALYEVTRKRREQSLPYLSTREDMSDARKEVMRQLAQVARGERDTLELSLPDGIRSHDVRIVIGAEPTQADGPSLPLLPGGE